MKNIRKYMMAAACMTAAAALVACTEAVKRDTEEEIQEMTVPKKPGPITKVPATLTCNGGEEFTFSVSKVQWAETYEWTIAEQEKSKISIIDGQGTNVITVRVVNDDVVIPAQSVSVVAKNELGASKVREYFAAITVSVPIELPGYTIKKYGKRWWMTENCHEAGEDGNLGVAPDLTAFSVAGLEASHLQRLNDAKGRYYTWYEAMTGISGCTAEQCPYVQNYEGVDDVGNAFKLDGTEEGEFGVQIRGCCPEGWHVANANDWWDMLMAIKSEYAIPDDFAQGGYTFSGGHDGKPENAITKAGFYKSGCTVKNTGNVGAWLRGGNGRIVRRYLESGEYDAHGRRGSPPAIRRRGRKHRFRLVSAGLSEGRRQFQQRRVGQMGLRVVHRADQRLDGPFAGHQRYESEPSDQNQSGGGQGYLSERPLREKLHQITGSDEKKNSVYGSGAGVRRQPDGPVSRRRKLDQQHEPRGDGRCREGRRGVCRNRHQRPRDRG